MGGCTVSPEYFLDFLLNQQKKCSAIGNQNCGFVTQGLLRIPLTDPDFGGYSDANRDCQAKFANKGHNIAHTQLTIP